MDSMQLDWQLMMHGQAAELAHFWEAWWYNSCALVSTITTVQGQGDRAVEYTGDTCFRDPFRYMFGPQTTIKVQSTTRCCATRTSPPRQSRQTP